MPEVHFKVRWPDNSTTLCYSPSSTITQAFTLNHPYRLEDFVRRSREALEHASHRVAQKYGFGCGQALAQIRNIETTAQRFKPDSTVTVEGYE